jgi:hypothetical protein
VQYRIVDWIGNQFETNKWGDFAVFSRLCVFGVKDVRLVEQE